MNETIQSYLIGLGFAVDVGTYNKAKQVLDEMHQKVEVHTKGMSINYSEMGKTVVATLTAITASTVKLLDSISQADLGYQKFALRMYMAVDTAKQLKIATDAMGESLEDIAWMPELRGHYGQLMKEARGMEPGGSYEDNMRYLRDIRFEFTRLKVEATYGLQHIGNSLFQYLQGPITNIHDGFKKFNDYIQKNLPAIADRIASTLAGIINLFTPMIGLIKDAWGWLEKIWDNLDGKGRLALTGGGLLALFVVGGPFTKVIVALTTAASLIQDFMLWWNGKNSSATMAPIWDTIMSWMITFGKIASGAAYSVEKIVQFFAGGSTNEEIEKKFNDRMDVLTEAEGHRKAVTEKVDSVKAGGSASFRNNNPLNLKFAGQEGAVQGSKAADGGYFAKFSSEEAGKQAALKQLGMSSYKNLTVDAAMRQWSNKGYGQEIAPELGNKTIGSLSSSEMSLLYDRMKKREGWIAGSASAGSVAPPPGLFTGSYWGSAWRNESSKEGESGFQRMLRPWISGNPFGIGQEGDRNLFDRFNRFTAESTGQKFWRASPTTGGPFRAMSEFDSNQNWIGGRNPALQTQFERESAGNRSMGNLSIEVNVTTGASGEEIANAIKRTITPVWAEMGYAR
jgi:hypothetical protein